MLLRQNKIYYNQIDPLRAIKIKYIVKKYKDGARYYCEWMSRKDIRSPFYSLDMDLEIDIRWDQNEWKEHN